MTCHNCKKYRCKDGSLAVSVEGCDCPKTVRVLAYLGAKQAARMHGRSTEFNPSDWTKDELLTHFWEEDVYFIPMVKVGWPADAEILLAQHAIFRGELKYAGKILSLDLMKAHSELEDQLAERMIERGIG